MKDTAFTITTAGAAAILGALAWPSAPGLAITAWPLAGLGLITWGTASVIRRAAR